MTPFTRISLWSRIWRSFACVSAGWTVMVTYLLIRYSEFASVQPRWYGMPMIFAAYSIPYILGVWLLVVLPLYCFLPPKSRLWYWPISTLVFAIVGFALMSTMFRFNYNQTSIRIIALAALVGGSSGLCCSLMQRKTRQRQESTRLAEHKWGQS